jgi:hypothetical protein
MNKIGKTNEQTYPIDEILIEKIPKRRINK